MSPVREPRPARQGEDEPRVVYLMGDPLFVAANHQAAARFVELLNAGAAAEAAAGPRTGPICLEVERETLQGLYLQAGDLHAPLILMHAAATGPLYEQLEELRNKAHKLHRGLERVLWP